MITIFYYTMKRYSLWSSQRTRGSNAIFLVIYPLGPYLIFQPFVSYFHFWYSKSNSISCDSSFIHGWTRHPPTTAEQILTVICQKLFQTISSVNLLMKSSLKMNPEIVNIRSPERRKTRKINPNSHEIIRNLVSSWQKWEYESKWRYY